MPAIDRRTDAIARGELAPGSETGARPETEDDRGRPGDGAEVEADTLKVVGLSKRHGDFLALDELDLTVARGEFVALLGPSGSGKTTTLMLVAGLAEPTAGEVFIRGRSVTRLPPESRDIGVVFQNYALFPHLTVERNVAFPLEMRRISRESIQRRVDQALDVVGLQRHGRRYPHELSGGEQQRVALARVLVFQPSLLLMDEPLGALDKKLRERMQHELRELHREFHASILYVTHDQHEAISVADRVAIIRDGRLEQVDNPIDLYQAPQNRFVADFIGDCNFLAVDEHRSVGNHWEITVEGYSGRCKGPGPSDHQPPVLALRPHVLQLQGLDTGTGIRGRVIDVIFDGDRLEHLVARHNGEVVTVRTPVSAEASSLGRGDDVRLTWSWSQAWVL